MHIAFLRRTQLDRIEGLLTNLLTSLKGLSMTLDQLAIQVKANTDLEASAIQLITGLASQLAAAATDPAKVQAIADELTASAASLAGAIQANTPAS